MGIYSLTYILNGFGCILDKKNRKIMNYAVIALLIFMSGTRYYMGGNDVRVYENVFNGAGSVSNVLRYMFTGVNLGVNENYETGFLLVCSVIKSLNFSYFGFTLIFAICFYMIMYNSLKEFVALWAPFWALFMYKIMFYDTFISIRQGMTIAIFCFSLKYIRDRKRKQYFLCCVMAFLMHRGALILFPVYFVQYIPISKKIILRTAIAFLPTLLIRNIVDIGPVIEKIIEIIGFTRKSKGWADASDPISLIHTLECYIMVLLVLLFYEKIISNKRSREAKLVLQLMLVTIPIFTLLSNWIVMTREKDYFVLMYGIVLGYIIDGGTTDITQKNDSYVGINNAKVIAIALLAACYIGMTRYIIKFDGGVLMNYTSFLTQNVSIFR